MLTDEIWQELEKATGISDLKTKALSEEVQEVNLTKTKHFAEKDYDIMYQNIHDGGKKEGYLDGKVAGEEMSVKDIKRSKGLEFEGKTVDSLVEYYNTIVESKPQKVKEEVSTEYEKDINALRLKLDEKDNEINNLIQKHQNNRIDSVIDNHFNAIQIEIPSNIADEKQRSEYVKTILDKEKTFFKSKYNFSLENENIIAKNGEQILKDDLQNPLSIDNLVKSHIESSFIPVKQKKKGRGDGDYTPTHNELSDIRTRDEFNQYLDNKKILIASSEGGALYNEWRKLQNK